MFFIFIAYIIYFFSYTFPLNLHLLFLLTIISLDDKYKPCIAEFTWQILKYVHYIVFVCVNLSIQLTKFTNAKLKAITSREHTWDDLIPFWKLHSLLMIDVEDLWSFVLSLLLEVMWGEGGGAWGKVFFFFFFPPAKKEALGKVQYSCLYHYSIWGVAANMTATNRGQNSQPLLIFDK